MASPFFSFLGNGVWIISSWHLYRTVIWRCNRKYEKGKRCTTPHVKEEAVKAGFVQVMAKLLASKQEVLEGCRQILNEVLTTDEQSKQIAKLQDQAVGLAQRIRGLVNENARTQMAEDEFTSEYDRLVCQYEKLAARIAAIQREKEDREFRAKRISLFIGLAKKVLIANRMGLLWDALRPGAATGGILPAWVGIVAYTFQIYFDFSGYSDMACGLGNMLGLELMSNFNYPYISRSVTEFWRRWHISLSTWFRDYVYIPLGGSRRGKGRTILNLLAVWLLTGLWHGASWNFVAWGLYYFIILAMEKVFLLKRLDRVPGVARHLYTLLLVMLGWVLFYFDGGFDQCIVYMVGRLFAS